MNWATLVKPRRFGRPLKPLDEAEQAIRSEFEKDYDQIVFSKPFRRLQGKTQVFPLPETDHTHTRLTHSLEASCVGRSLGRFVGHYLHVKEVSSESLGTIVAAACLAHDLGNPPFGHSGESAIRHYFSEGGGARYLVDLSPEQTADFSKYEGNAAGFRILTHSKPNQTENPGGFFLTLPTLAAFTKYPRLSYAPNAKRECASEKKFGLFADSRAAYSEIAAELGLPEKEPKDRGWRRHPLAYLTEAADDICYWIMDMEDGFKLRLISYKEAASLLTPICEATNQSLDSIRSIHADDEKLCYLRAKAINSLVIQAARAFIDNEGAICGGDHDSQLISLIPSKPHLGEIEKVSKKEIYSHDSTLKIEAAGYEVLAGLLEAFLYATISGKDTEKGKKIRKLIPQQYLGKDAGPHPTIYENLMNVTEYVVGMTDGFAIDTYRILRGISLPNYAP